MNRKKHSIKKQNKYSFMFSIAILMIAVNNPYAHNHDAKHIVMEYLKQNKKDDFFLDKERKHIADLEKIKLEEINSFSILEGDFATSSYRDGVVYITTKEAAKQKSGHYVDADISKKFMHMSFDDCINVFADITNNANTYTSIFDNPFLGELKRIHDAYGMVFSLYCFMSYNGWMLSETTTKFASEFTANAEWLKFGFHSRDGNNYGGSTTAEIATIDYNEFISTIISITGSAICVDRAVRLHNFAGNLTSCTAMRDCTYGLVGFLSADDTRASYYFTSDQAYYINKHKIINDVSNYLHFFKSEQRLEQISNIDAWLDNFITEDSINMSNDLVLFTHEQQIYPTPGEMTTKVMTEKLESCARWAIANGYKFNFPMNIALSFKNKFD